MDNSNFRDRSVHAELVALMESAGRAMFDDREWNAPMYDNGQIVGANGLNSSEAGKALQAVAGILGIPGPVDVYDRLCESGQDTAP